MIDYKEALRRKRQHEAEEKAKKPKRKKKPEGELSPTAQAIAEDAGITGKGHKAFLEAVTKRLKGEKG